MEKKSPQTYSDQFARGPIFFCCICMQQQTMSTSTFETVGSRSQISKACYGHVYGNITSQTRCGTSHIQSPIGEFQSRAAECSNKLLRHYLATKLRKLPPAAKVLGNFLSCFYNATAIESDLPGSSGF